MRKLLLLLFLLLLACTYAKTQNRAIIPPQMQKVTIDDLNKEKKPILIPEAETYKNRKTIYYENNLGNKFLTTILTILFFGFAGYLVYRRKTYSSVPIIILTALAITAVPTLFHTLTSNVKELYIRSLGIEVRGTFSYRTETKTIYSKGTTRIRSVDIFNFSYISEDNIKRVFSGKYNQFKLSDLNAHSFYGSDIIICLSKNGEEAAIQLPRHQRENINNIIIISLILIILLLIYIGVFDKPMNKLYQKIEQNKKERRQKRRKLHIK